MVHLTNHSFGYKTNRAQFRGSAYREQRISAYRSMEFCANIKRISCREFCLLVVVLGILNYTAIAEI